MRIRPLFVTFILLTALGFSCKKTEKNPCEGLLNEGSPRKISVIFVDKETGENLIAANKLDTNDVKITPHTYRGIVTESRSPLYGAVVFTLWEGKAGEYQLNIQVGDFGTVKLSYAISREKTQDICRPYVYIMSDVRAVDYPFEYVEHELIRDKKSVLKVAL